MIRERPLDRGGEPRGQRLDPRRGLLDPDQRVEALAPRLSAAVERPLADHEQRLALSAVSLKAISPYSVLARGYSITQRRGSGEVLVAARDLGPGDELETKLARGTILSRVEATADGVDADGW